MREPNTPSVDARYWAGMLAASLLGTTLGDYVSISLGLGYASGLPLMMGLLAAVLAAERRFQLATRGYYWAAVVITRTAATNLADLATHRFKLGYPGVGACLGGLLVATVLARTHSGKQTSARGHAADALDRVNGLPRTDLTYWAGMLIASTLGTTLGDFMSDELQWSLGKVSLALAGLLTATLYARRRASFTREAPYWSTIVLVRTTGTTMGDFLSGEDGLKMGFGLAASCSALALVFVLAVRPKRAALAGQRAPAASQAGVLPAPTARMGAADSGEERDQTD